jgi:AraC-like DNA-binding protein
LFDDVADFAGTAEYTTVTGPGWLIEIISLISGEIAFARDGELVRPVAPRFGILLPPFSIVRFCLQDAHFHTRGLAGRGEFPQPGPHLPRIFEIGADERLTSAAEISAALQKPRQHQSIEVNTRPSRLTLRGKKTIDAAYRTELKIAQMAQVAGVTHAHLTRQFRSTYGLSPIDYCRRLRAADASARLLWGEKIIEVSQEVGFNDLSRFYKQFRQKLGTSPGRCK